MQDRTVAGIVLLGFAVLLGIAVYRFLPAFIGALIIFTLFFQTFKKLEYIGKKKAALMIMLLSFVIILIPFLIISSLALAQAADLVENREVVRASVEKFIQTADANFPQLELTDRISTIFTNLGAFLANGFGSAVNFATDFFVNIILMYVLVYFMFVDHRTWKQYLHDILPFSTKNEEKLMREFANVTQATIVGSGVIAVVQGLLVGTSMWIAGLGAPIIWGFVAGILSFLPVIGTPVVWIPAAAFLFFEGNYIAAVVFLLFNIVVTMNIDNVLRPIIGKKVGNMHPLTSFLGVFFGLYLFGFAGIILGPLLISNFFMLFTMYQEEFGQSKRKVRA